jgi:hypothetical protein
MHRPAFVFNPSRRFWGTLLTLTSGLTLSACGGADDISTEPIIVAVTFDHIPPAWTLGDSDYTDGTEPSNVTLSLTDTLPAPIQQRAVAISGTNRSDDMYAYIKRPVTGLAPSSVYQAEVSVTLAASVPQGCLGVGGSPGESVYVKTTVSGSEPQTVRQNSGEWALSIDKGNQANSGTEGQTLGHIANSATDCRYGTIERKTLRTTTPITVTTDAQGRVWWGLGQDSGYEAGSTLVLLNATLTLSPQ